MDEQAAAREAAKFDLQAVMSRPEGRRVMHRLLQMTGVYRQSFTGDALSTAFREGERSIGLKVLEDLRVDTPLEFSRMLAENAGL